MVDAVQLLKIWLGIVAGFRTLSVVLGYIFPGKLLGNVFGPVEASALQAIESAQKQRSGEDGGEKSTKILADTAASLQRVRLLLARLFAVWTTITCLLCVLSIMYIDSVPILAATFGSFVAALVFFLIECTVFGNMYFANIISPGIIASISAVWLAIRLSDLVSE